MIRGGLLFICQELMKDMGEVKGDLVAAKEQLHEEKVHVLALPRIHDS